MKFAVERLAVQSKARQWYLSIHVHPPKDRYHKHHKPTFLERWAHMLEDECYPLSR